MTHTLLCAVHKIAFHVQNVFRAKLTQWMGGPAGTFMYYDPGSVYLFGLHGTF